MNLSKQIILPALTHPQLWVGSQLRRLLVGILQAGPIPEHVAFVMDGNRRYAAKMGISFNEGHLLGAKAMEDIMEFCYQCGVKTVTVFAFSIENFKRPKHQLDMLMELAIAHNARFCQPWGVLDRNGVALRVLGRLDMLDHSVQESIKHGVEGTRHYGDKVLNICFAYTSRDEISTAVKATVLDYESSAATGPFSKQNITAQALSDRMFTAGCPKLDLLIRTSGVQRLSDFLLWQCHEDTHIEFVNTLWPAFGVWQFLLVLLKWQRRVS